MKITSETSHEEQKQIRTPAEKALSAAALVICAILLPILIFNITLIIKSYQNKDVIPSFGGIAPMIVMSDSMYPVIETGDMIIIRHAEPEAIKTGDVISFYDPASKAPIVITHRVIELLKNESGEIFFRTKGDFNEAADVDLVPGKNLIGTCGFKIAKLGAFALFMQTTEGLILCVALPIVLLVGYDIIRARIKNNKKDKSRQELLDELERLKNEMNSQRPDEVSAEVPDEKE